MKSYDKRFSHDEVNGYTLPLRLLAATAHAHVLLSKFIKKNAKKKLCGVIRFVSTNETILLSHYICVFNMFYCLN